MSSNNDSKSTLSNQDLLYFENNALIINTEDTNNNNNNNSNNNNNNNNNNSNHYNETNSNTPGENTNPPDENSSSQFEASTNSGWEIVNTVNCGKNGDQVAELRPDLKSKSLLEGGISQNNNANHSDNAPAGYLEKLGNRGLLKLWKTRYFRYNPEIGALCYFRNNNEVQPLGYIPLRDSSIQYCADPMLTGQFQIVSGDRTYFLASKDEQSMKVWIKQLTLRRKEINDDCSSSTDNSQITLNDTVHSSMTNDLLISQPVDNSVSVRDEHRPRSTSKRVKKSTYSKNESTQLPIFTNCQNCLDLKKTLNSLQGQVASLSQQLSDKSLVINSLQDTCRTLDAKCTAMSVLLPNTIQTPIFSTLNTDNDSNKTRTTSTGEANNMTSSLKLVIDQLNSVMEEKNELSKDNQSLTDENLILKEMIDAKESVVISLTERIYLLEHNEQHLGDSRSLLNHEPTTSEKYNKVIQQLSAYKENNDFLKIELNEIHSLLQQKGDQFQKLENDHSNLEAEHDKLSGKHLVILQEISNPTSNTFYDSNLISGLLAEALENTKIPRRLTFRYLDQLNFQEFDVYGFTYFDLEFTPQQRNDYAKAYFTLIQESKAEEAQHFDKWTAYVQKTGRRDNFAKSRELKELVRYGIPQCFRKEVWRSMIFRESLRYRSRENYYTELLQISDTSNSPFTRQIELDLLRTLPNNKFFRNGQSEGIKKLKRVLIAYSFHNSKLGYCQGINRLAALLLLLLDEQDAFWGLIAILDSFMPAEYYTNRLIDSQVDQRVFMELVAEKMPRLYSDLISKKIDISISTFHWFFTIFIDTFPSETMFRIWDCFLYEGSKVLFRFSLAILKMNEDKFMNLEPSTYFREIKQISSFLFDHRKLAALAFHDVSLSIRDINRRRNYHKQDLYKELTAVDKRRQEMCGKHASDIISVKMSDISQNNDGDNSD